MGRKKRAESEREEEESERKEKKEENNLSIEKKVRITEALRHWGRKESCYAFSPTQ